MKRAVLIIAFIALAIAGAKGQQVVPSLAGTDFWVSFLRGGTRYSRCYILIASEHDCTARIENPFSGSDTTVFVPSGEINRVLVPDDQSDIPFGLSVANEAWHVVTDVPAIVYIKAAVPRGFYLISAGFTPAARCFSPTLCCTALMPWAGNDQQKQVETDAGVEPAQPAAIG